MEIDVQLIEVIADFSREEVKRRNKKKACYASFVEGMAMLSFFLVVTCCHAIFSRRDADLHQCVKFYGFCITNIDDHDDMQLLNWNRSDTMIDFVHQNP
jgi:hypothetical protein